MKNKRLFLISIFCFLIDQLSKQLVLHFMTEDQSVSVVSNFFSLTYVKNTGIAFSMLEGNLMFIIIMTFLIIGVIFHYLKETNCSNLEGVSYGMIIGGAFGNLLDRLFYGFVVDFLDFQIFGKAMPIFNLADCMIVMGAILLVFLSLREGRGKNENICRREDEN